MTSHNCQVITQPIVQLAQQLGIAPEIAAIHIADWQDGHIERTNKLPTVNDLQALIKQNKDEKKKLELNIPNYTLVGDKHDSTRELVYSDNNTIYLNVLPEKEPINYFFEKEKDVISPQEHLLFYSTKMISNYLLWREQAKIENGLSNSEEDIKKVHNIAIEKLKKLDKILNIDRTKEAVQYTAAGQPRRTYYIQGTHIYNEKGQEIYDTPGAHRNAIFSNYAIQKGTAALVNFTTKKGDVEQYVVHNSGTIVSVTTKQIMKWPINDSKRMQLIELAKQELLKKTLRNKESNSTATNNEASVNSQTINIYAGTNENADLSNFAERPFTITSVGIEPDGPISGSFKTVEGAFQAQKLAYSLMSDSEKESIKKQLETANGATARSIGRKITKLDTVAWDNVSSGLMKNLLKASFEQNPQAAQRLLATGNATLTHTQDKGKWGTEFPKLLMEVREELKNTVSSNALVANFSEEQKNQLKKFVQPYLEGGGLTIDSAFKTRMPDDVWKALLYFVEKDTPMLKDKAAWIVYNIKDEYKDALSTLMPTSKKLNSNTINVSTIATQTVAYGVHLNSELKSYTDEETKKIARKWLTENPNGIIAFRLSENYATLEMAKAGAIGNPFNWKNPKYKDNAAQLFMDWLLTGNNFGEPLATEEYRQAIISKLLSIDTPNILYYKELNRPSHATVLGYLIEHKELLQSVTTQQINNSNVEFNNDLLSPEEAAQIADFGNPQKNSQPLVPTNTPNPNMDVKNLPEIKNIGTDISGIQTEENNPYVIVTRTFSPLQRKEATVNIAARFSRYLDLYVKNQIKRIKKELKTETDSKRIDELQAQLTILQDPKERKNLLSQKGGLNIITIYNDLKEQYNLTRDQIIEQFQIDDEDFINELMQLNKKTYDNFSVLFEEACVEIERREPFSITIDRYTLDSPNTSNVTQNTGEDTTGVNTNEQQFEDDEEGVRQDNGLGLVNIRTQDLRETLSSLTKQVLGKLYYCDNENPDRPLLDSYKEPRYLDKDYAHSVLLNICSEMVSPSDFYVVKEDEARKRTFRFPLLEKYKSQYPWIHRLIKELKKDESLISAFYADFRADYINYVGLINGKKFDQNKSLPEESLITGLINNYEKRVILSNELSIYTSAGELAEGNISVITSTIGKVQSVLADDVSSTLLSFIFNGSEDYKITPIDTYSERKINNLLNKDVIKEEVSIETIEDIKNFIPLLTDLCRGFGFNIKESDIFALLQKDYAEGKTDNNQLKELLNKLSYIVAESQKANNAIKEHRNIAKEVDDILEDTSFSYIRVNNNYLAEIAKILGTVTEADNKQTFRQGKNTYPSYSKPNYIGTLCKKLKSEKYRQDCLKQEFEFDSWFFNKERGEYYGEWFNVLANKSKNTDNDFICKNFEMHEIMTIISEEHDKTTEYTDWEKAQIKKAFISHFFDAHNHDNTNPNQQLGHYNFPIFSDSPMSMFVTFKKYIQHTNENGRVISVEEQMMPLFRKVVLQELARIKYVKERCQSNNNTQEISYFDKNGLKFQFFPELNNISIESETSKTGKIKFIDRITEIQKDETLTPQQQEREINSLIDTVLLEILNTQFTEFLTHNKHNSDIGGYLVEDPSTLTSEEIFSKLNSPLAFDLYNKGIITKESLPKGTRADSQEYADALKREYKQYIQALKEYFWNQAYATTQIIQMTVKDIAYYKNDTDFQKRFKQVYAAGTKLNTSSKYGRKIERAIYIADSVAKSRQYDNIKQVLLSSEQKWITRVNEDRTLTEAQKQGKIQSIKRQTLELLDTFKKVNYADAQAFRCLDSYRAIMDMIGNWNDVQNAAFERIKNGEFSITDIYTVWQTIKPFMFSTTKEPKYTKEFLDSQLDNHKINQDQYDEMKSEMVKIHHQNKNSEFLVLAMYDMICAATSSPMMKALSSFMTQHSIDVAGYESMVKTGNHGTIDLEFSKSKLNDYLEDKNNSTLKEKLELFCQSGKASIKSLSDINSSNTLRKFLEKALDNGIINNQEYNEIRDNATPKKESEFLDILSACCLKEDGSYDPEVVHEMSYDDYVIQQPTPEHVFDVKSNVFGSQFRNIIVANLEIPSGGLDIKIKTTGKYDSNKITLHINTKEELIDLYYSLITENLLDSFEEVGKRFVDGNTKESKSIYKMQKALQQQVRSNPKYGNDLLQALEIIKVVNPITGIEEEVFNVPFSNPSITSQLQELVTSMFKNKVTKQTIRGGACILVSNVGYTDNLSILYNDDGSIKGVECFMPAYSRSFYEELLVDKVDNGNHYKVLDISKLDDDLRKLIGYRIPTEEKYSMAPLYIKDFLPEQNGSAIMYPAELMTFSGEDCDVDKKFLMLPNFKPVKYFDRKKFAEAILSMPDFADKFGRENVFRVLNDIENGQTNFTENSHEKFIYDFYINHKDEYQKVKHRKIYYDLSKSPEENTKEQRDNLIIDIAYAILTSKSGVEQMHKPGNFEGLKKESRFNFLMADENSELLSIFIDKNIPIKEGESSADVYKKVKNKLMSMSRDEFDDFISNYGKTKSQLSIDTFIYYHNQNMQGKKLIGIYANNTTAHAKFQNTQLEIRHGFKFNNKTIKSLHDIYDVNGELVSANCAQFSAASVDNVKDPVLASLMQNPNTASITCCMLRLGLDVRTIGLMFSQPIIKNWIDQYGRIDTKKFTRLLKSSLENRDTLEFIRKFATKKDLKNLNKDSLFKNRYYVEYSTDMLVDNILKENKIFKEQLTDSEKADLMGSQLQIASLFLYLCQCAEDLNSITSVSKADSPNNAIGITLGEAIDQVMRMELITLKSQRQDFRIVNFAGAKNKIVGNLGIKQYENKNVLRERIKQSKLSVLQAFHSLGIEIPTALISNYFQQVNETTKKLIGNLYKNALYSVTNKEYRIKAINKLLQAITIYHLSQVDSIKNNTSDASLEDMALYYKYKYIDTYLEKSKKYPQISQLEVIKHIVPKDGKLVFTNSARLTKNEKTLYGRELESLFYINDPNNPDVRQTALELAKELFLYAYFNEGLEFGPNNYGYMFTTMFYKQLGQVNDSLRFMKEDMETNPSKFNNFLDQFYSYNKEVDDYTPSNDSAHYFEMSEQHKMLKNVLPKDVSIMDEITSISQGNNTSLIRDYIKVIEQLPDGSEAAFVYKLHGANPDGTLNYIKLPELPIAVYDMNTSVFEMADQLAKEGITKETIDAMDQQLQSKYNDNQTSVQRAVIQNGEQEDIGAAIRESLGDYASDFMSQDNYSTEESQQQLEEPLCIKSL